MLSVTSFSHELYCVTCSQTLQMMTSKTDMDLTDIYRNQRTAISNQLPYLVRCNRTGGTFMPSLAGPYQDQRVLSELRNSHELRNPELTTPPELRHPALRYFSLKRRIGQNHSGYHLSGHAQNKFSSTSSRPVKQPKLNVNFSKTSKCLPVPQLSLRVGLVTANNSPQNVVSHLKNNLGSTRRLCHLDFPASNTQQTGKPFKTPCAAVSTQTMCSTDSQSSQTPALRSMFPQTSPLPKTQSSQTEGISDCNYILLPVCPVQYYNTGYPSQKQPVNTHSNQINFQQTRVLKRGVQLDGHLVEPQYPSTTKTEYPVDWTRSLMCPQMCQPRTVPEDQPPSVTPVSEEKLQELMRLNATKEITPELILSDIKEEPSEQSNEHSTGNSIVDTKQSIVDLDHNYAMIQKKTCNGYSLSNKNSELELPEFGLKILPSVKEEDQQALNKTKVGTCPDLMSNAGPNPLTSISDMQSSNSTSLSESLSHICDPQSPYKVTPSSLLPTTNIPPSDGPNLGEIDWDSDDSMTYPVVMSRHIIINQRATQQGYMSFFGNILKYHLLDKTPSSTRPGTARMSGKRISIKNKRFSCCEPTSPLPKRQRQEIRIVDNSKDLDRCV